jgi:hypothetical protein
VWKVDVGSDSAVGKAVVETDDRAPFFDNCRLPYDSALSEK